MSNYGSTEENLSGWEKFSLSAQSGFQPLTKNPVKPSSHHNKHPSKHLETSLKDTRLRKTKLTVHITLNVASMTKYSQKEYGHLGVSHYDISCSGSQLMQWALPAALEA